ncbi:hypothetical protein GGI07_004085 [Coemansia sp. Benny D115]|nr:hypothetical protein GGI07_004085 [Coemansia sp. Benny D115]
MPLEGLDLGMLAQALSVPTQEALELLPQVQKETMAWRFAFELLESSSYNCRFFGAHTLQVKISRDWDTLDEERQEALRNELLQQVVQQCDGPLNVLNKITQALAAYALRTVPEQWSSFLPTAIDAIEKGALAAGKSSASAGHAIVDLLELFPEELNRASIGSVQSARLVQDVRTSLATALGVLSGVVRGLPGSPESTDTPEYARQLGQSSAWRTRAWKAILQWLQFGVPGDTLFVPLLDMGLQQLEVYAAHQLRTDGAADDDEVAAAAAAVDDMVSNLSIAAKYTRTVGTLALGRLSQPWMAAVLQHSADSGDEQVAVQWGSVLVSFGETYTELIVGGMADAQLAPQIGALLQMLLALTRFPGCSGLDEGVSDQPLNFWYLLQETLVDYIGDAGDDPQAAQAVAATRAAVGAVFVDVLRALVGKCAYPHSDAWSDAGKDERDRFLSYRRDAGDAILNAYYVLREEMLALLVDEAVGALRTFSLASWQRAEALLFALRSIGEAVPETEAAHLPRLFSAELLGSHFLPVLQANVAPDDRAAQWGLVTTKTAVLALIGAYGDWWRGHADLLPVVVPCVTSSLAQPSLVQPAVAAFRRICDSCREQLADASESMVGLACEVLTAGAATVPPREQQRIFESVAEVVMAQPPERQPSALVPLLAALASVLNTGAQLLASAPHGLSTTDLEPFVEPLVATLRLVEALARGLQFADDSEERAVLGEPESAALLERAARCYAASPELCHFRALLLETMQHVFGLPVWRRDPLSGLVQLDDALLESTLAIINGVTRRGPHALALGFSEAIGFVASAWQTVIACPAVGATDAGALVLGRRWADQCPSLVLSVGQLVAVSASASCPWRVLQAEGGGGGNAEGGDCDGEHDRMLGALLGRVVCDVYVGVEREAGSVALGVEQQPVINEYVFDLCTRALQTRAALFGCVDAAAVGRLCELSAQALSVPNRLALKPTAYFLTALIRLSSAAAAPSRATELLAAAWGEFGGVWVRTTLAGIGGAHPRSLLPNLAELLFAMIRHHPASTRRWMTELLAQPGFPSPHADAPVKQQFAGQAVATRSFVKFKALVSEFAIQCRNLQGTAYAG